jgi:hypothetical protein
METAAAIWDYLRGVPQYQTDDGINIMLLYCKTSRFREAFSLLQSQLRLKRSVTSELRVMMPFVVTHVDILWDFVKVCL